MVNHALICIVNFFIFWKNPILHLLDILLINYFYTTKRKMADASLLLSHCVNSLANFVKLSFFNDKRGPQMPTLATEEKYV